MPDAPAANSSLDTLYASLDRARTKLRRAERDNPSSAEGWRMRAAKLLNEITTANRAEWRRQRGGRTDALHRMTARA